MLKIICKNWKDSLARKFEIAEILRTEEEYCDVTLQSADKVNVKVHKLILIIGSNYFRDMFSSGMKETSEKCIKYSHIKGDVLEKVIKFMYTGELEAITIEKVEEIAICANYFQLDELIEECAKLLSESIDDENCLKYWRLAHECFHENFERKCITHILLSSNFLYEDKTFFDQLDKDEVKILLNDHRLKWSEEVKFENILKWTKGKSNTKEEFSSTFSMLLEVINFMRINEKFVLSTVVKDDDLAEHKVIRNKIMQRLNCCANGSYEDPGGPLNTKESQNKLFAFIGDELKIISDCGSQCTLQKREKCLWNVECTVFNNCLFTCGGRNILGLAGRNICEYFDPSKSEWIKLPNFQEGRCWHASTFHEDKIYICGGASKGSPLLSVEVFDFIQSKWIPGKNLNSARCNFGLVSVNRALYAVGGYDTTNIEMFDPRTLDKWIQISDGFQNEHFTQCVSVDTNIYCFRGDKNPHIFDTNMNKLRECDWANNYLSIKKGVDFRVCFSNGHFNFIQRNHNEFFYIDFYKYDLKGNRVVSKPQICHRGSNVSLHGFEALNYE